MYSNLTLESAHSTLHPQKRPSLQQTKIVSSSKISGLFACRYHGLKAPPFELASKRPVEFAAPTIFLHSIREFFYCWSICLDGGERSRVASVSFSAFFHFAWVVGSIRGCFWKKNTVPEEIRTNMSQDSPRHHFSKGNRSWVKCITSSSHHVAQLSLVLSSTRNLGIFCDYFVNKFQVQMKSFYQRIRETCLQ